MLLHDTYPRQHVASYGNGSIRGLAADEDHFVGARGIN